MGGAYASGLELWSAPGDSEMDVVRNAVALERVVGSTRDIRDGFDVNDVGYNPEIYVGEEKVKGVRPCITSSRLTCDRFESGQRFGGKAGETGFRYHRIR
ncbi:hypothetical protein ACHAXA_003965 [Cyclostephanos tholiformis]|uniref:Uncharacterized protein n=1 Tax=Cyclostephanos tholiformis TaxID=382380 RepID=A0ABD3R6V7_9STRA